MTATERAVNNRLLDADELEFNKMRDTRIVLDRLRSLPPKEAAKYLIQLIEWAGKEGVEAFFDFCQAPGTRTGVTLTGSIERFVARETLDAIVGCESVCIREGGYKTPTPSLGGDAVRLTD